MHAPSDDGSRDVRVNRRAGRSVAPAQPAGAACAQTEKSTPVSHDSAPQPLTAMPGLPLRGALRPPGDKSISHRAMILGLLSIGETRVEGLLEGDDVLRTAAAARALGADVERLGRGALARARRRHRRPQRARPDVLDFGNAGTGSRLMMGVVGGQPITATFDGDASLRKRPMRRILDPLVRMGDAGGERGGGRAACR